jgi:hypothetical protein
MANDWLRFRGVKTYEFQASLQLAANIPLLMFDWQYLPPLDTQPGFSFSQVRREALIAISG